MADTAESIFRDYVTDNVAATGNQKPSKAKIREWGTWLETAINSNITNTGLAYGTRSALFADLAHDQYTSAWVIADSTAAYNGIYIKTGASGAGSWTRFADLPYSFIKATNVGAGTANNILATSSIAIPTSTYAALITLNIVAENTGPAQLTINTGGFTRPIVDSSGNALIAGSLKAGMAILVVNDGTNYRMLQNFPLQVVRVTDAGAGSANALQATSNGFDGTAYNAILSLNVFRANTGAATLSINGGTARAIVTNSGQALASGYLTAGMVAMMQFDGTNYRLLSDVASTAIQAAAAASAAAAAVSETNAAASAASIDVHQTLAGVIAEPSVFFDNTRKADQGNFAPNLNRNFYWKANFGWFYTGYDDARLFAGDSQFGWQSFSRTVNGANTAQVTGGPYVAGATVINTSTIGSPGTLPGKTLTLILDQVTGGKNETYEGKITAATSTSITFSPALPSGKTITVGAIFQLYRAVWSRVSTIIGTPPAIGTNVFGTNSSCGLAGPGEYVRVQYDDGTWFISTVASYTGNSITTVDNTTKAITLGPGKLIYVGTMDVDPNVSIDRGGMPNVPGDIMGGFQWSGRTKQNGIYRQFRIIPYVVDADIAGGTAEMDVQFQVTDQSGGNFVPTFSLRRGLIGSGSGGADPGLGGSNWTGLMVNGGSKMVFMKRGSLAAVNYGTVNAGTGVNASFSIVGAVVGDEVTVTLGSTHRAADGIIWTAWVNSTNNVTVRAFNPTGSNIVVGSDTLVVIVRRLT